jgi:predicted dehydrogenase
MGNQIKWGVMGNAEIARVCVIPAIQKSRNGMVHGFASRSLEQAKGVAKKNYIERLYDSYETQLNDPKIDAVYIPLPNHLHHPWTLRALQEGKHVLCEKPLACNAREAEEMASAADDANLLLMEGLMYRFHPRSQRIKEMVADGAIGTVCLVRFAFCYPMAAGILASGDNARLKPEMGGGALLDVGCYGVSLARWILGLEPSQLQAQAVYHNGGVDIHVVASLSFADGSLATLEASFVSALQQTYTVVGTEGAIELPHDAFIPWEKETVFTMRKKDQEIGKHYLTPGADEYQLMVEHFGDAIMGKTALACSAKESVGNMKVLDALAQAAKSRKTMSL